jgi:hypothetical protein
MIGRSFAEVGSLIRKSSVLRSLDAMGMATPLARLALLACSSPAAAMRQYVAERRQLHSQGRPFLVFALPKSGSTLTEFLLRELGYVDVIHSVCCRRMICRDDAAPAEQARCLFRWVGRGQPAFAKTHLRPDRDLNQELIARGIGGLVQIRDIRDALISRYHHVRSDPRHRHHAMLRGLPEIEGIKRSFFGTHPGQGDDPIRYFSAWIVDWMSTNRYPVVRYEQLIRLDEAVLAALREVTGRDSVQVDRLRSAMHGSRGGARTLPLEARLRSKGAGFSTFRNGTEGEWRRVLDREAIDLIKRHAQDALIAAGYEKDSHW